MEIHRITHDRAAVKTYALRFPANDHISKQLRSGYPYERELLSSLAALLEDGDVVVDVGAHAGNHSIYLALARDVRVHAYEPNPAIFQLLRQNVEANGLSARVACHQVALGERSGRGAIEARGKDNSGATAVRISEAGSVTIRSLASERNLGGPLRIVKIDVEGSEQAVLRGAASILRRDRPILALELQRDAADYRSTRSLLADLGYRMVSPNMAATPTYLFASRVQDARAIASLPQVRHRLQLVARSRLRRYAAVALGRS